MDFDKMTGNEQLQYILEFTLGGKYDLNGNQIEPPPPNFISPFDKSDKLKLIG